MKKYKIFNKKEFKRYLKENKLPIGYAALKLCLFIGLFSMFYLFVPSFLRLLSSVIKLVVYELNHNPNKTFVLAVCLITLYIYLKIFGVILDIFGAACQNLNLVYKKQKGADKHGKTIIPKEDNEHG